MSTVATDDAAREIGRLRAALVRICEMFEDGWPVDEIRAHAEAAAEVPIPHAYRCHLCGITCRWPGELDDHLRFTHWDGHPDPDDCPHLEEDEQVEWVNGALDESRERDREMIAGKLRAYLDHWDERRAA
jgi:hypothetical protein